MHKLNAKQEREIEKKSEEWKEQNRPVDLLVKRLGRRVKGFMDSLMFNKRPRNIVDRLEHYMVWWTKIIIIFCALAYIMK